MKTVREASHLAEMAGQAPKLAEAPKQQSMLPTVRYLVTNRGSST